MEERKKVTSKYPLPKNCQALLPPKVNEEIEACISEPVNKTDRLLKSLQYQLGHGLSAIGQVMDAMLKGKSSDNLSQLADGAMLVANVQFNSIQFKSSFIV